MVSPQETSGDLGKGLLVGWLSQEKPLEVVPLELHALSKVKPIPVLL